MYNAGSYLSCFDTSKAKRHQTAALRDCVSQWVVLAGTQATTSGCLFCLIFGRGAITGGGSQPTCSSFATTQTRCKEDRLNDFNYQPSAGPPSVPCHIRYGNASNITARWGAVQKQLRETASTTILLQCDNGFSPSTKFRVGDVENG